MADSAGVGCGAFSGDAASLLCSRDTSEAGVGLEDADDDCAQEVECAARSPHTVILAVAASDEDTAAAAAAVTFSELRYVVKVPEGDLVVLDGTSGSFANGRVTAVLGASGAGKTSLLDAIAGRIPRSATLGGSLIVAGAAPTEVLRKRYSGYCQQRDALDAVLTVRETLECAAELKCSQLYSGAAKRARAREVLEEMGLSGVANTLVGGDRARGVSGGQRKRCAIGLALVSKPPVLLLDEPTSGLDAATADEILGVVAGLARSAGGRVVAATLHCPSSRAFRLSVDDVLVLGPAGRVLFAGAAGADASAPLPAYLAFLGQPLASGDALADHAVYVLASRGVDGGALADAWAASAPGRASAARVAAAVAAAAAARDDRSAERRLASASESMAWHPKDPRRGSAVATSPAHGVLTLLRFRSRKNVSDGEFVGARLGDKLVYGLVIGSLYFNEGLNRRDDGHAQNVASLLWMSVVLPGYGAAAYIPSLVEYRSIFVREVADGAYAPATYVLWKVVEECAVMLPFSAVFVALLYFMVSLKCRFLVLWLTYYANSCVGIALAYALAGICSTTEAANALLPTYVTVNIFFVGFLILRSDIPLAWRWYCPFNYMMYGWIAVMKDEFRDADDPHGGAATIRRFYDLDRFPEPAACLAVLAAFFAVFIALAWASLRRHVHS